MFLAFTTEDGTGFFGISRSPDFDSVKPGTAYCFEILRVTRFGPTEFRASFSRFLDKPGAESEIWEFVGGYEQDARLSAGAASADTPLPKFGDYVWVDELPEAVERVPPDYPTWARENGIQGTVMVQALVGRDGRVKDTRVSASVEGLDDYAIGAVKQWRFRPARSKGKPVAVWVGIPVKFSLH